MCLSPSGLGLKSTVETAVSVSHWSGGAGRDNDKEEEEKEGETGENVFEILFCTSEIFSIKILT